NFTVTLDVLRAIAEIVPDVELPDLPFGVVGGTIIAAEGVSAFDDLMEGNRLKDLTAPEDRTGGYGALAISARDYLRALRVLRLEIPIADPSSPRVPPAQVYEGLKSLLGGSAS